MYKKYFRSCIFKTINKLEMQHLTSKVTYMMKLYLEVSWNLT